MFSLLLLCCLMPVRDGSVIFCQDGLLVKPIYNHTGSTIVHTAIILYENDKPYVFEATWPRVRKVPLEQYYQILENCKKERPKYSWFVEQPRHVFTDIQLTKMKQYANSQLGRRYMLRGWVEGREVRGIFCSEYTGNILEQSGLIKSANFKESPISLKEKIKDFYD